MADIDISSPQSEAPSTSSSIQTIHRTESSRRTTFINAICRPFRNHIGRPYKKQPYGSVQLKAPSRVRKTCTVTERQVANIYLYTIQAKRKPEGSDNEQEAPKNDAAAKRIYYFSGGGWQTLPMDQHWNLCAELATRVEDCSVTIVSYPLAPRNPAPKSFPMLQKLYRILLREAADAGARVLFAGDSAGGNIALALVLEALREDAAAEEKVEVEAISGPTEKPLAPIHPHPVTILAISPSVDLTRSNPAIQELSSGDSFLTPAFVTHTAKLWHGDWDAKDPRVSPLNADISLLARAEISVHGVVGGRDILGPDALLFRDKCEEEGVKGQWLFWDGQMHCFPLLFAYGVPEANHAVDWCVKGLNEA